MYFAVLFFQNATRKPSYIAIQPMQNFKAAVVSVVIHLPTGDEEYAPPCQSGVAIGASLVSLGEKLKQLHLSGDRNKFSQLKQLQ